MGLKMDVLMLLASFAYIELCDEKLDLFGLDNHINNSNESFRPPLPLYSH